MSVAQLPLPPSTVAAIASQSQCGIAQRGLQRAVASPARGACPLASLWRLSVAGAQETSFVATTAWHLGRVLVLVETDAPARDFERTPHALRTDGLDHYHVVVSFGSGGACAHVAGCRVQARRGQPLVLDMAQAARIECAAGGAVHVLVPRELLEEQLNDVKALHGAVTVGSSALILGEYLRGLAASLPELRVEQAPDAAMATVHMIAAGMATAVPLPLARGAREATKLRQACRYIDLHLENPALSATDVCAAVGVSRPTLYRLLEPYGGVARHIRERRLARARELILATSGEEVSIAQIGERCGFGSATHFSRSFREEFGCCPSRVSSSRTAATTVDCGDDIAAWIRALRG